MKLQDEKANTVEHFLTEMLCKCYQQGATDIHLEPDDGAYRIRCRIGGKLLVLYSLKEELSRSVVSRIKLLSGMDPANRLSAQDGRFSIINEDRQIDFRVSVVPLVEEESLVLRVLDPLRIRLSLDDLGMRPKVVNSVRDTIRKAHGMLLVCGPTGAGKTTTLYAALEEMDRSCKKVLTAEDPVEYLIDDCTQVPVEPYADLGFVPLIRAFLRQDPDVILVGEIRDSETARLAFRAGLTGHLVLTSLHASDTLQAISRLLHMGVSPSILSSVLTHVIAQRLLRKLCLSCRQEEKIDTETAQWNAVGCTQCMGQGYQGQIGIFESVNIYTGLMQALSKNLPTDELRRVLFQSGKNVSLRAAADFAVSSGLTTIEEVERCL